MRDCPEVPPATPLRVTGGMLRSAPSASGAGVGPPGHNVRRHANARLAPEPQATLVAKLEAAFGGDPGARIFLQAALRSARRSTLPPDPLTLLAFARAHLVDAIAGELGPAAVAAFLEEISGALQPVSGVAIKDADDGPACTHSGQSKRGEPRLRILLVHADRLARARLARALVSGGCDVTVVEAVVDLASILDELPDVAVVDLAANEVEHVLEEMVRRNSGLRVLALSRPGVLAGLLDRCEVQVYQVAQLGIHGREVLELSMELARR